MCLSPKLSYWLAYRNWTYGLLARVWEHAVNVKLLNPDDTDVSFLVAFKFVKFESTQVLNLIVLEI